MLIMKSGKRKITEGIELPNQERIRMLREKENSKYLGILGGRNSDKWIKRQVDDDTLGLTGDYIDYACQEKEEEDLSGLNWI